MKYKNSYEIKLIILLCQKYCMAMLIKKEINANKIEIMYPGLPNGTFIHKMEGVKLYFSFFGKKYPWNMKQFAFAENRIFL